MACIGGCTLCCCCGTGEMKDLPDYYCRFYATLPAGSGLLCTDTTRQKLNWLISQFNLDSTSTDFDLQSPFFPSCSGCLSLGNDEDTNCWMTYERAFPYGYAFGYSNDTHWTIIEESECFGSKFFSGMGVRDYCYRTQTQARVKYGIKNMKVNIARCRIPNAACDAEVSELTEGKCGYLVTATFDVQYKVYIFPWTDYRIQNRNTGTNQCENVNDFPDPYADSFEPVSDPLFGISVETYTECITRSVVVETLKNDTLDPERIYIEFERQIAAQDVQCCKDWQSPNLVNQGFPEGKPEGENDELFRCSCDSELSLLIEGECQMTDCTTTDPAATYSCTTSQIQINFMAGNKWILSW